MLPILCDMFLSNIIVYIRLTYTIHITYTCKCIRVHILLTQYTAATATYRAVYIINYSYNIYIAAINAVYTYDNYCVVNVAVCM